MKNPRAGKAPLGMLGVCWKKNLEVLSKFLELRGWGFNFSVGGLPNPGIL